jgi:hypothetical protein
MPGSIRYKVRYITKSPVDVPIDRALLTSHVAM